MSQVTVRLFAALRELAGSTHVEAEGSTVDDVVAALGVRFGERFEQIARSGSAIVNGERADGDRALLGNEDVALLPPVSGG